MNVSVLYNRVAGNSMCMFTRGATAKCVQQPQYRLIALTPQNHVVLHKDNISLIALDQLSHFSINSLLKLQVETVTAQRVATATLKLLTLSPVL